MKDLTAKEWCIAYVVALIAMGVLDAFWLGAVARDFYRRELGDLMATPVRIVPAALFYLAYPAAIVYFGLNPRPSGLASAARRCGLLGLLAYGTYDLTNLSTLRGWSLTLTAVDIAWGLFATALAGTLACWFAQLHAGAEGALPGPAAPPPRGPDRQRLL